MNLSLGFSPCPNDTFIFDALVNGKIDTEGIEFGVELHDVQTLNQMAAEGVLDVTKLSFPALFQNRHQYAILNAGAALGKGVGPLLISKKRVALTDVKKWSIAIPGKNTTAAFLLKYAFPEATNTTELLFSNIEDAVLKGDVDLGVIIHENRFTYAKKGLLKVMDLGEHWEQKTSSSIPLGCIAVKRTIDEATQKKINRLIRQSLVASFQQYPQLSAYVTQHAQEMEESVMRQHIELYVNDFTADLGVEGRKAIDLLYHTFSGKVGGAEQPLSLFSEGT